MGHHNELLENSKQSKSTKPKKKIAISILPYLLSALSMLLGFFVSFFLARTLGAELYGEIRYLISLFSTFSSILLFGLSNYILREAKNPEKTSTILNKSFSFVFALTVFLIPIIFRISKSYLHISDGTYLICIILASVSLAISTIYGSFCQGIGNYHITQLVTHLAPKILLLLISIGFYFFLDYSWFSSKYILFYTGIYGSLALIILFFNYRKFDLGFKRKDYLSLTFFFATTFTYSFATEMTNVIQGALYDNTVVLGVLGVSNQILSLLSIFTTVVGSIVGPLFAKYKREKNITEMFNVYRLGLRATSYFAIPFYLFLITQGEKFLIFFGESYLVYPLVIIFATIGSAFSILTGQTGTILLMTGKEKIEVINGIVGIGIYALFAVVFKNDRIYGLVIANMANSIGLNILKFIEVWVIYKTKPLDSKTVFSILIITCLDFAAIFFLKYISNWVLWLGIGITVGLALIILNFVLSLHRHDFRSLLSMRKRYTE